VGFGHSGTTSLQESYFPNNEHINYIGKPFSDKNIDLIYGKITKYDSVWFEQVESEIIQYFAKIMDTMKAVNVISAESFTTHSFIGLHSVHADNQLIIERMSRIFDRLFKVKIVVSIRSQQRYLRSAYYQHTQHIAANVRSKSPSVNSWLIEQFRYLNWCHTVLHEAMFFPQIERYCDWVGLDNILILPLEYLIEDKELYYQLLDNFMTVDHSQAAFNSAKHINKTKVQAKMFPEIESLLKNLYSSDNERMTNKYKLNKYIMKKYNYF
jgi:hypothetical protein